MLPALADEGLVDAVDAFCEGIAFSRAEVARVFDAAWRLGLPVKLHADQLSNSGGATLAAEFGALSADHLEYADEAGVDSDGARGGRRRPPAGRVLYFARDDRRRPVELFRKHRRADRGRDRLQPRHVAADLAPAALNMAATLFRLTVEECLAGRHAQRGRARSASAETGTLEPGKWADLAIWDVERPAELVYRLGFNPLHARVWRGR